MGTTLSFQRVAKFGVLAGVAVGGSLIFGAAAGAALSPAAIRSSAALLTLSTGCSWVIFGVVVCWVTRKPILDLAEACLIAMAFGEAILVPGAGVDWAMFHFKAGGSATPVFNIALVLLADVVMCLILARRLNLLGVPRSVSVYLWIGVLNGSWVLFVALFGRILNGGRWS